MSALSAEVLRRLGDLQAIAPDWWQLWSRCPSATPFQSPAWLIAWWQTFAPGELLVITIRAGDRLVALAPFYVRAEPGERRARPLGVSVSDYLDLLVDPEHESAIDLIGATLAAKQAEWDALELPELARDAVARKLRCPPGCAEQAGKSEPCPVIPTATAGFDVLPLQQRKLRQAWRRAGRRGQVRIDECRNEPIGPWLDLLFRLHGARWQAQGEDGILADERLRIFHSRVIAEFCERGIARLFRLQLGDAAAGIYYGFHHRDRAYAYIGGFDPDYAFESPGTILLGHAIATAAREGGRAFDFLRGSEAYKYRWGARDTDKVWRLFRRAGHAA